MISKNDLQSSPKSARAANGKYYSKVALQVVLLGYSLTSVAGEIQNQQFEAVPNKTSSTQWSAEQAEARASHMVTTGRPFLYSSGGFVCTPKFDAKYEKVAVRLPIQSLACGCVLTGTSMRQMRYARHFNNHTLSLLEEPIDQR